MIKRILWTIAICLVLLVCAGWFLLYTGSGLKVSARLVTTVSGGALSIGGSDGRITGNWLLRDILIQTEAVDITIGSVSCEWQPRRLLDKNLHIADLTVEDVKVTARGGTAPDKTADKPFELPAVALPIPFLIGQFLVEDIAILDDAGKELFSVRSLSARLDGDGHRLDIDEISLDAPYIGATGDAQIVMSGDWPITAASDWWARVEGCTKYSGRFEGSGTLADPQVHIALAEPGAVLFDAAIKDLFNTLSYQLSVSGSDVDLTSFCVEIPGTVDDLQADVTGDLSQYSGSGQAALKLNGEELISATLDFSGDREQFTIDRSSFDLGTNRFDAVGSLIFASGLRWNATLSTRSFDISEQFPVPGALIDGNLDVYGKVEGGQVIYDADIRDLAITILDQNVEIGGGLSLHGDQTGLEITQSNFVCGEGTIGVKGAVNWQDYVKWEADVLLESFDPAVIEIFPQGSISGILTSAGSVENEQLALQAEIVSLSGELSGYELTGEGLIEYRDKKLTVKDLSVTNGNNMFRANGDIDENYDMTFQINASELERIFPLLSGTLNVDGTVEGVRSNPKLSVEADGKSLIFEEYGLDEAQAKAAVDIQNRTLEAHVGLVGLHSGELSADRLIVDLSGGTAAHEITGILTLPRTVVSIHANGTVQDGETKQWAGEVEQLKVVDNAFGEWKNKDPILLAAGAESATVKGACLYADENALCADLEWAQGGWSVASDTVRFDLNSFNRWGLLNKPLTGVVEGKLRVSASAAGIDVLSGSVSAESIKWEPGPNRYYREFEWLDTSGSFNLVEDDLVIGLATRFVDNSTMEAEIGLTGVTVIDDFSETPLTGRASLDLKNVEPLSVVTAEFLVPEGHVSGTVELGGTLSSPLLTGDVKLVDGGFHLPLLGIDMTDVNGTVGLDGWQLDLNLEARAGAGILNTNGRFDFGADVWSGHLGFTGADCSLLDRRAIFATANPNLDLNLGPEGGSLTGDVEVVHALVEVEKIDRSTTESSDVVFVDKVEESIPWPFRYDIEVTLGDDVNVEGFGLTAKLGGHLKVVNNANGTTIGRGFLDVNEGNFVVYGSPLTIERGRLSFDGGPVDNPGIDIKASKFIDERRSGFEKIEVGANVIGSAAEFEVELYSLPSMEEGDILTYILFDNPFSSEGDGRTGLITSAARALGFGKGSELLGDVNSMLPVDEIRLEGGMDTQETSLVVGKNLSKELSVSYDYNLFDSAGSFRVRYEFGKGFSVESRNSFESNAVELLYSFER